MCEKNILVNIEGIEIDLFEYIDKNSKFLKEQYLNIIFDLSNLTLNNQPLKNQLYFQDYSLWEMSLIQEKNIYKNRCIFKTIKYLALNKIIKENKYKYIEIFFLENDLANYLEKNLKLQKLFLKINLDSFKVRIIQIIKKIWFQFLFFIYYFLKNCTFRKFDNKVFSKKKFLYFSFYH